jgi:hypothetical protein
MTILGAALFVWTLAAPIPWVLRDGLGPGMVETVGVFAVFKFFVPWGTSAIVLGIPLLVLIYIEGRRTNEGDPTIEN